VNEEPDHPRAPDTERKSRSESDQGGGKDEYRDPYSETHKVLDARELRALAHPVRMTLLELLSLHHSLTATRASKLAGGSPTSVAYHLRTLAKYGYVEEAEGGTGRERPWRIKTVGYRFNSNDPNPETRAAAQALQHQLFRRWLDRRQAFERTYDQWPQEVREVTGDTNFILIGTSEEIAELRRAWGRLTEGFIERIEDPAARPEGAHIFELQLFTHAIDATPYEITED
jgi:DNA-binding transcriptional ArsR family regulator